MRAKLIAHAFPVLIACSHTSATKGDAGVNNDTGDDAGSGAPACKRFGFPSVPWPTTGLEPTAIAIGDLDDDGKLDLVTANIDANTVSVLLGNGDGTFQTKLDYTTGEAPQAVAIADIDADGKLDLITANLDASTISVLLGNGDGTFRTHSDAATDSQPTSIVV